MNSFSHKKKDLANRIMNSQTRLNFNTSKYKTGKNNDSGFLQRNVRFQDEKLLGSEERKLASIQKSQIDLKILDKETDLLQSRILEEENL